ALNDLPEGAKILANALNYRRDKEYSAAVAELGIEKGKILFNQVKLRGRLNEKSKDFDPVALRLFYNLLLWE
ncbi:MAG: hypothetical protein ABIA63_06940, partial [bacterium]